MGGWLRLVYLCSCSLFSHHQHKYKHKYGDAQNHTQDTFKLNTYNKMRKEDRENGGYFKKVEVIHWGAV